MNAREHREPRFFLTRQSANLMEGLERELSAPGALCLLYGTQGVGKTSLLEYFCQQRMAQRSIHWINLQPGGKQFRHREHNENKSLAEVQQQVLDGLEDGALLVVDALEHAPRGFLDTLLRLVTQQAQGRGIAVLLCCAASGLGPLRKAKAEFKVELPSVELGPLQLEEAADYLAAIVCTEAASCLHPNRAIKQKLKTAQGYFPALNSIASQLNPDDVCIPACGRTLPGGLVWVLSLVVLGALGAVLFSLFDQTGEPRARISNPAPAQATENEITAEIVMMESADREPTTSEIPAQVVEPESAAITRSPQNGVESGAESDGSQQPGTMKRKAGGAQPDLAGVAIEPPVTESIQGANPSSTDLQEPPIEPASLLRDRIKATRQWLAASSPRVSSIQVMSVAFRQDLDDSMIRFIQQLDDAGLDLNQVYIYPVRRSNRLVNVVLYGDFPTFEVATKAIEQLPAMLKANKPYARSVRGITREIEKYGVPPEGEQGTR